MTAIITLLREKNYRESAKKRREKKSRVAKDISYAALCSNYKCNNE
jgi:hypothetical protein